MRRVARIAGVSAALWSLVAAALIGCAGEATASAEQSGAHAVRAAAFGDPTDRYPHNVLGPIRGWGLLTVDVAPCAGCAGPGVRLGVRLPETSVFEDIEPRLWDVTGDGTPEIVVVESDARRGARLSVWAVQTVEGRPRLARIAATGHIGTRFRWLAPVGIADFTGDGMPDIAYVETPHLGRVLRIVTMRGDRLVEIASAQGFTNHRIGEPFISGGLRQCGELPEIILASPDWAEIRVAWFDRATGRIESAPFLPLTGPASFDAALSCS